MALVKSSKAHAGIVSVDTSVAESMPGVHGVVTHRDVPGSNITGAAVQDEEVFATDEVYIYIYIFFQ